MQKEFKRLDAWISLAFQFLVISVFSFMSWQYLIVRHNASSISVFFFATPLFGMILGVLLLDEAFDEELTRHLKKAGLWIETGEGCATDLFICMSLEED